VPDSRQPELIARLLNRVLTPGGRLTVCAYRPRGAKDAEPIGELLQGWGFPVRGEETATDATDGATTHVAWIDAASLPLQPLFLRAEPLCDLTSMVPRHRLGARSISRLNGAI
jgi:hypothetical protein